MLILDEPTIGLDPAQIIEIRELIKSLAGEHTVILSTHILPEVSAICRRVVIINEGRIVAEDSLDNLTGRAGDSGSLMVRIQGPAEAARQRIAALAGVLAVREAGRHEEQGATDLLVSTDPGQDLRRAVAETVIGSGAGLLELRAVRLSLEDIFMQTITRNS